MDVSQLTAAQWQALMPNYLTILQSMGMASGTNSMGNMMAGAAASQMPGSVAQMPGAVTADPSQLLLAGYQASANPATSSYGAMRPPKPAQSAPYEPPATHGKDGKELTTLWIGDLLEHTTQRDLLIAFGKLGTVLNVNVKGGDRLQGWVRFATRAEAEAAIAQAEQRPVLVLGQPVTCRWARNNVFGGATAAAAAMQEAIEMTEDMCTLWIGSIPPDTNDADFIAAFNPYGELVAAALNKKSSHNGMMAGWVRYRTRMEAEAALTFVQSQAVVVSNAIVVGQWAKANAKLNMGNSWERALPPSSHTAGQSMLPLQGRSPQLALPAPRPMGMVVPPGKFGAAGGPSHAISSVGYTQPGLSDQLDEPSELPWPALMDQPAQGQPQTEQWQPSISAQSDQWQQQGTAQHDHGQSPPAKLDQWQPESSASLGQLQSPPSMQLGQPPSGPAFGASFEEMNAMFAQLAQQQGELENKMFAEQQG